MQGSRCGIYGANSPEWIITMEVNLASNGRITFIIVATTNYLSIFIVLDLCSFC